MHNIAIEDVSNKLNLEKQAQFYNKALKPSRRLAAGVFQPNIILDKYLSHSEINMYLDNIHSHILKTNPNIISAVDVVGLSYEGILKLFFIKKKISYFTVFLNLNLIRKGNKNHHNNIQK